MPATNLAYELPDREQLEDLIERLIGVLDTMDPDPDLEPSLGLNGSMHIDPDAADLEGDDPDNEADLGWTDMESRFGRYAEGDTSEPSLGSLQGVNQEKWSHGGIADLEQDKADDEPSLGSCEAQLPAPMYWLGGGHGHCLFPALYRELGAEPTYRAAGFSQLQWGAGGTNDQEQEHDGREPCCEDEGAQCDDEGVRDPT